VSGNNKKPQDKKYKCGRCHQLNTLENICSLCYLVYKQTICKNCHAIDFVEWTEKDLIELERK